MKIFQRIFKGLFLICLTNLILVSGCGKSPHESTDDKAIHESTDDKAINAIANQEHKEEAKKARDAWKLTPDGQQTTQAMNFLTALLKSGKLPDTENAQRRIYFRTDRRSVSANTSTNYPISRTLYLKMKSSEIFNVYTMSKNSADDQWQIKKAWRAASDGQTLKMYPSLVGMIAPATTNISPVGVEAMATTNISQ